MPQPNSEIIIYQNQQGNIKVDVRLEDETVWLTQAGNPSKKKNFIICLEEATCL